MTTTTFGERLRRFRLAAGLSQEQLAGGRLSSSYVCLLEQDRRRPSPEVIEVLASKLGCRIGDLDGRELSRQRVIDDLDFARFAVDHGEAPAARDRLKALLAEGPLTSAELDESLLLLGRAHERSGDLAAAARAVRPLFDRALAHRSAVDLTEVAVALLRFELDVGRLDDAIRDGEAALRAVPATCGDGFVRLAATLQAAYRRRGDFLRAAVWAEVLIALADRSATRLGQGSIRWNAARSAQSRGRLNDALGLGRDAFDLISTSGSDRDVMRLSYQLAQWILLADPTRVAEAVELLDAYLARVEELGTPLELAEWEQIRAHGCLLLGQPAQAEALARRALLRLTEQPVEDTVRLLITLGDALAAQGRLPEAVDQYRAADLVVSDLPTTAGSASIRREIADRMSLSGTDSAEDQLRVYGAALESVGIRVLTRGLPAKGAPRGSTPRRIGPRTPEAANAS